MAQKQELRGKKPPRRGDGRRKRAWPEAARNSCRPGGETGNRKIFVCAKTPAPGCGETKALRIYIVRERRTFYELSPSRLRGEEFAPAERRQKKAGLARSGQKEKPPRRRTKKPLEAGTARGVRRYFVLDVRLALRPGRAGEDRKADRGGRGPTGASARMFAWRCGREGPGRTERRTGEGAGLPGHLRGCSPGPAAGKGRGGLKGEPGRVRPVSICAGVRPGAAAGSGRGGPKGEPGRALVPKRVPGPGGGAAAREGPAGRGRELRR